MSMPETNQLTNSKDQPVIHLALCMAGAISAGAYTAGVVDYLLEALERWEMAKLKWPGNPLLPKHRVVIDVITGASAGGMEGGILFRQGQNAVRIITQGNGSSTGYDPEWFKKHSRSYKAWVKLTETETNPQLKQLFDAEDIRKKGVVSLLNSDFIDKIADELMKADDEEYKNHKPSYISESLELCLSLSNLNGIPYSIPFNAGEPKTKGHNQSANSYTVYNYKDYGHFVDCPDNIQPEHGQIPVNFKGKNYENALILKQCLKATGAFPIGLKFRKVERNKEYILNNPLLSSPQNSKDISDDLPDNYATLNVDGGMMNNEPFDVAAYLMYRKLKGKTFNQSLTFEECVNRYTQSFKVYETIDELLEEDKNLVESKSVFSTILMVDPFPTVSGYEYKAPDEQTDLLGIIRKIYGAFRGQLLMKPEDLYKATSNAKGRVSDYSRFMIAPRRKIILNRDKENNKVYFNQLDGSDAIACGSLEGFGGFIDQQFREHDYRLGRFNCQHFIQKKFGFIYDRVKDVPEGNFINQCYIDSAVRRHYSIEGEGTASILPFIPDISPFGDKPGCIPMFGYWGDETDVEERILKGGQPYPVWPKVDAAILFEKLTKQRPFISKRISRIIGLLGPKLVGTGLVAAIGIYVMKKKAGKIADTLIQTMIDNLRKHKLVE
jgi:predicted acylesterase/phospholipase RssA